MVAVNVICADTDERAEWLAGPAALSFLRLRSGMPQPLASPEEAAAYPYTPGEREIAWGRFADQALGSPDTVRAQLSALLERTGADELMLTTMVYDIADRIRSFELVTGEGRPGAAPDRLTTAASSRRRVRAPADLTVSEVFPLEVRAKAIAVFFAIGQCASEPPLAA